MITKKDLIKIADTLIEMRGTEVEYNMAQLHVLADALQRSNPRFNRERWIGYVLGRNGPNGGRINNR